MKRINKSNFGEVSIVNPKKRINKRGDKYYIMISLILGLIVLSLSLYFIFQEYFNSDMIDQESCRQSVILRANLPEAKFAKLTAVSFKDKFPLKCKTQVIKISKEDIEKDRAGKIIADTLVQCWNLFGNGDFNPMPSKFAGVATTCVPCARISLTPGAKKLMTGDDSIKIDIEAALREGPFFGTTYYNYLRDVGDSFPALGLAGGKAFNLSGSNFSVDFDFPPVDIFAKYRSTLINRKNGKTTRRFLSNVTLPKYFNVSLGDLLVGYGDYTFVIKEDYGQYTPYLFYFQIDQPSDPFLEVKKTLAQGLVVSSVFCTSWEGIPA